MKNTLLEILVGLGLAALALLAWTLLTALICTGTVC